MKLKTSLYDYQKKAVEQLIQLKVGALFMDMGTGKTRIALELFYRRLSAGRVDHAIWLCPTSGTVKQNLVTELNKHAEGWEENITICGIETLSTSYKENKRLLDLSMRKRCFLAVDESSLVKNPYALRSKNVTRLAEHCKYRYVLNGTPISRTEADLFSQFNILDWRILGYKSYWSFSANHLEFDDKYKHRIRRVLNVDYLTDKIAPYTVQIKKDEVIKFPAKHHLYYYFDLTDNQEMHYYYTRDNFLSLSVWDSEYGDAIIFRTFNALQLITSGRYITTRASDATRHKPMFLSPLDNPRIKKLLYVLDEVVPDDEKVIIWCKYLHEVTDIASVLQDLGYSVALSYGKLSHKQRGKSLIDFSQDTRFFISTKSCGGFGLNMQFCCYEIFYNNDFSWMTRSQAEERICRPGQTKEMYIIDICAESKIDIRILSSLDKKENLADEFRRNLKSKSFYDWLDGKD